MLAGKLSSLNETRGVPNIDQAYEYLKKIKQCQRLLKLILDQLLILYLKQLHKKYEKFNTINYKVF